MTQREIQISNGQQQASRDRNREAKGLLSLDHRAPSCAAASGATEEDAKGAAALTRIVPEVQLTRQRPPRRAVQDVKVDQRDGAR